MTGSVSDRSPKHARVHELVAIGCGPFNLGLAALASRVEGLDFVALDERSDFSWHSGLMFDDARLQLTMLADLVTMIDPTHPLSFLAYLKDKDRLYQFFIREAFHPTRLEYQDYLRWARDRLPSVRGDHAVSRVSWDAEQRCFELSVRAGRGATSLLARNLVVGIGTEPYVPVALRSAEAPSLFHSASYLHRKDDLRGAPHVTVVGSGQSAAEVVLDLLRQNLEGGPGVTWLTRTGSFAPLDTSKLVLEMTTPAYVRYFHQLAESKRDALNARQWQHYRGISVSTLEDIYELLYAREFKRNLRPVELRCGVEVRKVSGTSSGGLALGCLHFDTNTEFTHETYRVICATGYRERPPHFLAALDSAIRRDGQGRFSVSLDYSLELDPAISGKLFVSNAELHTHGVATPDLGVAAYRNATILNTVLGREQFVLPSRTAFSAFAPPVERLDSERRAALNGVRCDTYGDTRSLGGAA